MKKAIAALLLTAVFCGCLGGCSLGGSDEAVSVQSVGLITGTGSVGAADRFSGKVISGDTAEVKRDADKTVAEVVVEVGDWVQEGDVLFSYDTEALQLSLEKLQLELQGYENTITSSKSEIEDLEEQKSAASADNKLAYTLQIDAKNADISEAEYNKALKQREIEKMEQALENTDVTAPIGGMVMEVTELDSSGYSDGSSDAFITIMDMGTYRVEGNINELNIGTLMEDMSVIIRSRIDESKSWKGTITSIDWEHPVTNSNDSYYYYSSSDEMTTSSKYPFYVELESMEDMIFGQHVYIEPDYGQDGEQLTLLLPAYYICDADSNPYVWAMSKKQTLEKRSVTLGAYDENLEQYEILSGLAPEDYIAWPADGLKEGMSVTLYDESSFGFSEEGTAYTDESGSWEDNTGMESQSYYAEDGQSAEPAYSE